MRALCDFHHGDLYESLCILFEDRLGWELYRPIGLEWFREGYWHVYPHEDTARQYLALELSAEYERLRDCWLNGKNQEVANGLFHIPDPHHGRKYKAITLPAAKAHNFDIVISTMPQHFEPYERFRAQFAPRAKHVFQMGNAWSLPFGCKNILNSTSCDFSMVSGLNWVNYHQEFSLKEYAPGPCANPKSMFNLMHFQQYHCRPDFFALRSHLPGWDVREYGAGNELGSVQAGHMPRAINEAGFIWHLKRGGEGYGYNIHNAFACGRPMVIRSSLYRGLLCEPLFTDGQTCVDLDVHGIPGAADRLNQAAAEWPTWHENVKRRFAEVVNFDEEFVRIKAFLERLQ